MESAKSGRADAGAPSADEVREELERILASDEFHLPERARKFLRFVVEETLEGRRDYLKAFTIAQEVFGRRVNFDPQNDPVVRIEAGRLRRELERYYLTAGRSDKVVITIPKGGYAPVFDVQSRQEEPVDAQSHEHSTQSDTAIDGSQTVARASRAVMGSWTWPQAAAVVALICLAGLLFLMRLFATAPIERPATEAHRPTIVVEPFEKITDNPSSAELTQGLTDEIIWNLVRFNEVLVIAPSPGDPKMTSPEPRYALQGSVRVEGDRLRAVARLVRREDSAVIWADDYDADLQTRNLMQIESDLAEHIATAVAQPFGVIFQTDADNIAGSGHEWDAYGCTLSYYSYRMRLTQKAHDTVKSCLRETTARLPPDATFLALLSLTYLDEVRFPYALGTTAPPDALANAYDLAERAAGLDPRNARALQALMLASFFKGDIDAGLRAGAAAYAINPNDTEVAGEYGLRLAMSGKWETGCELISNAVSKSAGPKGYYQVGMALCAQMRGDLQAAELWSRMSDLEYNPMHHLVLASILGSMGKLQEASSERDWLYANAPALIQNVRKEVVARLARHEDQERFFAGLRAAGVPIEAPLTKATN